MTPARLAPSLPATALAGRDLHPQDIAGFAQRTPNKVLEPLCPNKISQTVLFSKPILLAGGKIAMEFGKNPGVDFKIQPNSVLGLSLSSFYLAGISFALIDNDNLIWI
jgi:hypothetical protein